ncbi:MAG: hypothetical protein RJQ09_18630 [Cyclobacteriaceae bacterium]
MDIQSEKLNLIEWITSLNDISIIEKIKDLRTKTTEDRIRIDEYSKELDEADAEIEKGEYLTHEDAVREIRSWRE